MARRILLAAAAVLAVIGGTLVLTAGPGEPPIATPVATPVVEETPSKTSPGELTRGPLMPNSAPTRLSIKALKVSVPLVGLGQNPDGTMEVPGDARTVGWYTKAPTPGSLGPAVLAGHVDFHQRPGTFGRLAALVAGDTVVVDRKDGTVATFAVTGTTRYAKDKFPSDAVYGPIDHAGLRLITCGGDFDAAAGHYRDNVVVYATLIKSGS